MIDYFFGKSSFRQLIFREIEFRVTNFQAIVIRAINFRAIDILPFATKYHSSYRYSDLIVFDDSNAY